MMTLEASPIDLSQTVTAAAATKAGYRPMTLSYSLPFEAAMLENVIGDLIKRKLRFVLVAAPRGVEVWRK